MQLKSLKEKERMRQKKIFKEKDTVNSHKLSLKIIKCLIMFHNKDYIQLLPKRTEK